MTPKQLSFLAMVISLLAMAINAAVLGKLLTI